MTLRKPLTGAQVAGKFAKVKETHGRDNYDPFNKIILLNSETYHCTSARSVYKALHEVSHALQHRERPNLFSFRWFKPIRLWLEWDAWNRSDSMMHNYFNENECRRVLDEKTKSLSTYGFPKIFLTSKPTPTRN